LASLWDWAGERPASSRAMHAAALNFLNSRDSSVFFFHLWSRGKKKPAGGASFIFFYWCKSFFLTWGARLLQAAPINGKGVFLLQPASINGKGVFLLQP
jgi:hypothetical protein